MSFVFIIKIKGITKTPVWRKLTVPADYTFEQFHKAIQSAFGWTNSHLYEFRDKERSCTLQIGMPSKEDAFWGKKVEDARKVKLSEVFSATMGTLIYIYDFGENWVHEISLDEISPAVVDHAICTDSRGQCPAEDYGTVWGNDALKCGIWDDDFGY